MILKTREKFTRHVWGILKTCIDNFYDICAYFDANVSNFKSK